MTDAEHDIFTRLKTAQDASGQRGFLFRWFITHHDDLAALLRSPSRPGWEAIAGELNREGLTMKNGSPITADYARRTWWKAAKAYSAHTTPAVDMPIQAQNVSKAPAPQADSSDAAEFEFAGGLKDWTKKPD